MSSEGSFSSGKEWKDTKAFLHGLLLTFPLGLFSLGFCGCFSLKLSPSNKVLWSSEQNTFSIARIKGKTITGENTKNIRCLQLAFGNWAESTALCLPSFSPLFLLSKTHPILYHLEPFLSYENFQIQGSHTPLCPLVCSLRNSNLPKEMLEAVDIDMLISFLGAESHSPSKKEACLLRSNHLTPVSNYTHQVKRGSFFHIIWTDKELTVIQENLFWQKKKKFTFFFFLCVAAGIISVFICALSLQDGRIMGSRREWHTDAEGGLVSLVYRERMCSRENWPQISQERIPS